MQSREFIKCCTMFQCSHVQAMCRPNDAHVSQHAGRHKQHTFMNHASTNFPTALSALVFKSSNCALAWALRSCPFFSNCSVIKSSFNFRSLFTFCCTRLTFSLKLAGFPASCKTLSSVQAPLVLSAVSSRSPVTLAKKCFDLAWGIKSRLKRDNRSPAIGEARSAADPGASSESPSSKIPSNCWSNSAEERRRRYFFGELEDGNIFLQHGEFFGENNWRFLSFHALGDPGIRRKSLLGALREEDVGVSMRPTFAMSSEHRPRSLALPDRALSARVARLRGLRRAIGLEPSWITRGAPLREMKVIL